MKRNKKKNKDSKKRKLFVLLRVGDHNQFQNKTNKLNIHQRGLKNKIHACLQANMHVASKCPVVPTYRWHLKSFVTINKSELVTHDS